MPFQLLAILLVPGIMMAGFRVHAQGVDLSRIKLPSGFKIEVYASDLEGARQMALSPSGVLFVGSRDAGKVYAVKGKQKFTLAQGLSMPVGVAYHKGDLYISAVSRILKIKDVEKKLERSPQVSVVYNRFPTDEHHGWKYIGIGPDNKLYVPVGAPCNVCLQENPIYATIGRLNLDGSGFEIVAHGVRNTVGFAWHPLTKKLWFTDNGRDLMGDDQPPCELNRLDKIGEHFGFPYCHGGQIADDKFQARKCAEFKPPVQNLGPHVAALGMKFYTGQMFPPEYRNQVFIAEHGSWNRSKKIGYRVTQVKLSGERAVEYKPFAYGWLDESSQKVSGRPVDLLVMPDGSMLVSDDAAGAVYRISYKSP